MTKQPYLPSLLFASVFYFLTGALVNAATLTINNTFNSVDINSVSYSVDGATVNQTSQATSNTVRTDPVFVVDISITDGSTTKSLQFYNTGIAEVRNNNFTASTGNSGTNDGVGVYDTNSPAITKINSDGIAAYEDAVTNAATNTNLMNYLFYDGTLSGMPTGGAHDYDLIYQYAWTADDYLVVAERDGNTFFELTPIGADGNVIAGANTLFFDAAYGWRTGYENGNDDNNGQDLWFSAASISKFFEGTTITDPNDQLVYGYRIDNDGNADVKFFGASDNTFTDNPENPQIVPEPSLFGLFAGFLALAGVCFRRENRRAGR